MMKERTRSSTRSAFVIAAPTSNAGKTTVSLGLMRALSRQGLSVQPFKCGPDYIDTKFHSLAVVGGVPSYNLDTVMMPKKHVQEVYTAQSSSKDVAIICSHGPRQS